MDDHHQGEPRKKRPRLNRVPSPIPAPIENQVRPQAAKANAEGGHQQTWSSEVEHAFPEVGLFIGVGRCKSDGREVQAQRIGEENKRWVNDHQVGLQERVEADSLEEFGARFERVKLSLIHI